MIKVDASSSSVVARCTGCHWSRLVDSRAQGYTVGAAHQRSAHPADALGLRTAERLATRHGRK